MAREFFKLTSEDGKSVYINRAYIVQAVTEENGGLVVYMDKSAANMSTVIVTPQQATQVWSWLMEDRK